MNHARNNRGYIAITTAIVLSLLVMVVAISLGSGGLFTRFHYVDFNNKQSSYITARSCLNHALWQIAIDPAYVGNETINVSWYSCAIRPVQTSGSNKIIESRAQIGGATTNLRLTVNSTTLSTVSLEELVKF